MIDREPVDVADRIMDALEPYAALRFPELQVALSLPTGWTVQSPPVLLIEGDGDPLSMWPVATTPTIRVTSWTRGRDLQYVHAIMPRLLTVHVPGIAKILRGTGVVEARDSRTKADLASFTVRPRARLAVSQ